MTGGNFLRRIMTPFAVELLDFSEEKRHRGYLFTYVFTVSTFPIM